MASLPDLSGIRAWAQPRRNVLAALGAGFASGTDFGSGVAKGLQALPGAMHADQQAEQMRVEEDERKAELQRQEAMRASYSQFFNDRGQAELAKLVADGAMSPVDAYTSWKTGSAPKAPIKLGEGDVLLHPDSFETLATGAENQPDTVVNVGGTDKFYDKMDETLAGQIAGMIEAGANARSNNIRLGQIENLLSTAPQGAQGLITQFAGSLGIPVEGADEVQAAQALINQMVPGQRPPGSGTMSDADLALFKQSLPAIVNQPGGNALIIQTAKAINEYYIAQSAVAERVANREISPAEGRKLVASIPNPLADFKVAASGGAPRYVYNAATGELE